MIRALKNLKNLHFNGLILTKLYNVSAKQVQRSYVRLHSRLIESLKENWLMLLEIGMRNWLVSSQLTWGIWQILTWGLKNLKNLHFNRLLLTKVNNVWAKNSVEELFLTELNTDAKFEGKMTCAFKNDMRNLAHFHQSIFGSLKFGTLMRSFCPK